MWTFQLHPANLYDMRIHNVDKDTKDSLNSMKGAITFNTFILSVCACFLGRHRIFFFFFFPAIKTDLNKLQLVKTQGPIAVRKSAFPCLVCASFQANISVVRIVGSGQL